MTLLEKDRYCENMNLRVIVSVLALVGFLYFMPKAFFYGAIWQIRAQPHENVSVVFKNGDTKTGTYSRSWSGQYLLKTKEGNTIMFDSFRSMTHPMSDESFSLLSKWRLLIFPGLLFTGSFFLVCLALMGFSFGRHKNES